MLELLLYTLVIYVTNGFCTFAALLNTHPLDLGKSLHGKRILGPGKTLEGLLIGFNSGLLVAVAAGLDFRVSVFVIIAALMGDLIGSFIKRRMGLRRGEFVPLMDQLGFVVLAYLTLSFFIDFDINIALLIVLLTTVVHRLANIIGYWMGIKKVPW